MNWFSPAHSARLCAHRHHDQDQLFDESLLITWRHINKLAGCGALVTSVPTCRPSPVHHGRHHQDKRSRCHQHAPSVRSPQAARRDG
ncbi:MAG: hypothetical protein ACLR4Z_17780 [Butyricicoccaceae bacterium]